MGGLFLNGINRKYCCDGFGCGCEALTIGAATDAASATAATFTDNLPKAQALTGMITEDTVTHNKSSQ